MDRQQAKEILILYRPGTSDQDDPDVAQALEFAKQDSQLARWLEEHCALQNAIRAKFRESPVPEGLLEQILSERKAALPWTSQRKAVALAAVAALVIGLFGIAKFYWPAPKQVTDTAFPAFLSQAAGMVLRQYPKMDLETNSLAEIQRFLAQKQAHGDYKLPGALAAAMPTGCATNVADWNGHRVAMICFNSGKTSPATQPDLFLFITDRAAVADGPPANAPQFTRIARLSTASWSEGDKMYVLGGLEDEDFLRKYF